MTIIWQTISIYPQLTTSELLLYLGWLFHLVRQICGEWSDWQLGVGGDLETASAALDDPVHVRMIVQGNVLPFPENANHHDELIFFLKQRKKVGLPYHKNSYRNVFGLCHLDVSYRSLSGSISDSKTIFHFTLSGIELLWTWCLFSRQYLHTG